MTEQRLIDANNFPAKRIDPNDCLCGRMYACGWNGVIHLIDKTPTIDPETLPIVHQLRKELEKVTAERDAAVDDLRLFGHCCTCCKWFDSPRCKAEEPCEINDNWEWRGPQKEE